MIEYEYKYKDKSVFVFTLILSPVLTGDKISVILAQKEKGEYYHV